MLCRAMLGYRRSQSIEHVERQQAHHLAALVALFSLMWVLFGRTHVFRVFEACEASQLTVQPGAREIATDSAVDTCQKHRK